jgi:transcriptional regulator of acetoin/glycerol metabolism
MSDDAVDATSAARVAGQRARAPQHDRAAADPVERAARSRRRTSIGWSGRAREASEGGLGSLLDVPTFEEFKHAAERAYLVAKLRAYDWNVSETARALDMPRSNLYKKIERYALSREGGGVPAPVSGSDEDDDA